MNMPSQPVLSVILAVKDPDPGQFDACVASIAALRNSPYIDLVLVQCGRVPEICRSVQSRLHRIRILEQNPQGVYAAYNRGLDEVLTPYVMVMGGDDLLLPDMDLVIDSIPATRMPHVVAAAVLMQGIGIARPTRVSWGLIFRNWCQQGILYRSDLFSARRFDTKYRMQADHKLNMELASDHSNIIYYRDEVVAHFSSSGVSQTMNDWVFRDDMPILVRQYYGIFFALAARIRRGLADVLKGRRRQRRREAAGAGGTRRARST